jgi:predicted secreted protein
MFDRTDPRAFVAAILLGSLLVPMGCGTGRRGVIPDRVDVLHPDATARFEAEVGEVIAFDLPGHAGTGYAWRPSGACPEFLRLIDGPIFTAADPNRVGSGGLSRFRYQVVAAGDATLAFDYVRSWENDGRPVRRSVVEVVSTER